MRRTWLVSKRVSPKQTTSSKTWTGSSSDWGTPTSSMRCFTYPRLMSSVPSVDLGWDASRRLMSNGMRLMLQLGRVCIFWVSSPIVSAISLRNTTSSYVVLTAKSASNPILNFVMNSTCLQMRRGITRAWHVSWMPWTASRVMLVKIIPIKDCKRTLVAGTQESTLAR